MSLAIDIDRVTGVLLSDGWHRVIEHTFAMDAYEFVHGSNTSHEHILLGGGQDRFTSALGAAWKNVGGDWIACPLSAILAVRYRTVKPTELEEPMSVIDVIGEHVKLSKRGKKYVGLCPFHTEKTPSFTVDPKEGFFHCFGCQAGGTVEDFLSRIEQSKAS